MMRVNVTVEDMALGDPNNAIDCAIAHAIIREHGTVTDPWVGRKIALVYGDEYRMPDRVSEWIDAYRDGADWGPISFDMERV